MIIPKSATTKCGHGNICTLINGTRYVATISIHGRLYRKSGKDRDTLEDWLTETWDLHKNEPQIKNGKTIYVWLNKEQELAIIKSYVNGATNKELCEKHQITVSTLHRVLREYNVSATDTEWRESCNQEYEPDPATLIQFKNLLLTPSEFFRYEQVVSARRHSADGND